MPPDRGPRRATDRHRAFADCFRRALERDAEAWTVLVNEYSGLVYGTAMRAGLSRDEAGDITQAVWTALLEKLDSIRDPQSLPKWLAVTAHRMALRHLRREHPFLSLSDDLSESGPSPEALLEQEDRARAVRDALGALSPRCRGLLVELFAEDRPGYSSVAERLGVPVGSIGPTRARCLARLSRILRNREI